MERALIKNNHRNYYSREYQRGRSGHGALVTMTAVDGFKVNVEVGSGGGAVVFVGVCVEVVVRVAVFVGVVEIVGVLVLVGVCV